MKYIEKVIILLISSLVAAKSIIDLTGKAPAPYNLLKARNFFAAFFKDFVKDFYRDSFPAGFC